MSSTVSKEVEEWRRGENRKRGGLTIQKKAPFNRRVERLCPRRREANRLMKQTATYFKHFARSSLSNIDLLLKEEQMTEFSQKRDVLIFILQIRHCKNGLNFCKRDNLKIEV